MQKKVNFLLSYQNFNSCDYHLWGEVEAKVCKKRLPTANVLEAKIIAKMVVLNQATVAHACVRFRARLEACVGPEAAISSFNSNVST